MSVKIVIHIRAELMKYVANPTKVAIRYPVKNNLMDNLIFFISADLRKMGHKTKAYIHAIPGRMKKRCESLDLPVEPLAYKEEIQASTYAIKQVAKSKSGAPGSHKISTRAFLFHM
jgi:hypothetical protein